MPSTKFKCPDGQTIEIQRCLENKGCRMSSRCATLPYLRLVGFDREFKGVSPSSAGNGARQIFLKATTDYIVDPADRVWASIGTGTHGKLSIHEYTNNVLSEEVLSDELMQGISDVLEQDEDGSGFILYDYKTWGSFKVAKAIGLYIEKTEKPILDAEGNPVLLKSGENKGKPKTVTEKKIIIDPEKADLRGEELQLNRYRIFFEKKGFPISKMIIQAIPRDGNTYIAENRGIDKTIYLVPIKRLPDEDVLNYYKQLSDRVNAAIRTGITPEMCNSWETWEGRRCKGYCEVSEECFLRAATVKKLKEL